MCIGSGFRYQQAMILSSMITQPMPGDGSENRYLPYSSISSIIEASAWLTDGPKEREANSVLLNHKKELKEMGVIQLHFEE